MRLQVAQPARFDRLDVDTACRLGLREVVQARERRVAGGHDEPALVLQLEGVGHRARRPAHARGAATAARGPARARAPCRRRGRCPRRGWSCPEPTGPAVQDEHLKPGPRRVVAHRRRRRCRRRPPRPASRGAMLHSGPPAVSGHKWGHVSEKPAGSHHSPRQLPGLTSTLEQPPTSRTPETEHR